MEISFEFSVPNFDRKEIEIDCPKCKLGNWAQLGQIKRREYLICRGCHLNILLEDHLGSVQMALNKLNRIFEGF